MSIPQAITFAGFCFITVLNVMKIQSTRQSSSVRASPTMNKHGLANQISARCGGHFAPASLLRMVLFSWGGPRIHVCRNLRRREPEQASDGHDGASDSWASSWVGLPSVKWKTRDQERGALFINQILIAEFQAELFLLDQLDAAK